jgi:hypothetical protein
MPDQPAKTRPKEGAPDPAHVALAEAIFQHVFGGAGDACDIRRMARLISGYESTRYYIDHMHQAQVFNTPRHLYAWALEQRRIAGLVLEFGVASGRTLTQIAEACAGQTVYGFDGFKGLPEAWKFGRGEGAFAREAPPAVPANAELVIGWFADTLPAFVAAHPQPVSYLHVDCDLYSSTMDILRHLGPHLAPGSVVAFNEYFNYPGWQHHEYKAWQEWVAASGARYRYLACNARHQQVAAVVESNPTFAFADRLRPLG